MDATAVQHVPSMAAFPTTHPGIGHVAPQVEVLRNHRSTSDLAGSLPRRCVAHDNHVCATSTFGYVFAFCRPFCICILRFRADFGGIAAVRCLSATVQSFAAIGFISRALERRGVTGEVGGGYAAPSLGFRYVIVFEDHCVASIASAQ